VSLVLLIIGTAFALELICWFRFDRLIRSLGAGRGPRALWSLFMAGNVLALVWIILGRSAISHPEDFLPRWALVATFLWHLLILPFTLVVWLVVSTGRGVAVLLRGLFSRQTTPEPDSDAVATEPPPPPSPERNTGTTRRQFLGVAVATAPPLVTALATGVSAVQLSGFRVRPMTLALPQLPPDLDGMTIAHVSDIHVGRFTQGKVLAKIVEATNNLRADLVLMTGDLINMELADLPAALDAVRRMDARSGVYLCEGNHDLMESRSEFERRTRASGVPLMINESMLVPVRGRRVQLLGLRWGTDAPRGTRSAERGDDAIAASMQSLLPQLRRDPDDVFPILMAHHPHAFDPAAAAGIPLTLSGHTHGGQLMLSPRVGFGPWMYRYWSGAYRKNDSALVVSNGVGNWFPLRVGAPAEIIHLTLRRAT
jgi:predicted MPP superfamily phosphohydrolase